MTTPMTAHDGKILMLCVKDALSASTWALGRFADAPCTMFVILSMMKARHWKQCQTVEMAGDQHLPRESQCHGRRIIEVVRNVMKKVDKSHVYIYVRMSNDIENECGRNTTCMTVNASSTTKFMSCWTHIPVSPASKVAIRASQALNGIAE